MVNREVIQEEDKVLETVSTTNQDTIPKHVKIIMTNPDNAPKIALNLIANPDTTMDKVEIIPEEDKDTTVILGIEINSLSEDLVEKGEATVEVEVKGNLQPRRTNKSLL